MDYVKINMYVVRGIMKKINLEELKNIQINILNVVDDFCKKNDIKYWIDCGTLLGAVRHKGYIPWDDDIDIGMLRDDYEKFMKLFNQQNDRYHFSSIEMDNNFLYPMGKVLDTNTILYEPDKKNGLKLSVNIDVFVYDNAPDNEDECNKMFKKRDLYSRLRYSQLYPNVYNHNLFSKKIIRFFLNIYFRFIPINYYTKKIADNSKKYVNEKTKRVGNFTSQTKFVGDKRIFESFVLLEFEKKKYPAPVGYDEWLTNFYGDYMKLPPKEKRVSHHEFEAYILEKNDLKEKE